ncbi:hypothetical protein AVEN_118717-1 [Araneus ventricosus]|uniref:Uncharacterized protein n=1 Tax=Araneus ventricosus TaxID=182803 RepID=A0A4Y2BW47_ARAVE|nr:hypothetical protein AVEN_118717-1 [Araneus ventricosus]
MGRFVLLLRSFCNRAPEYVLFHRHALPTEHYLGAQRTHFVVSLDRQLEVIRRINAVMFGLLERHVWSVSKIFALFFRANHTGMYDVKMKPVISFKFPDGSDELIYNLRIRLVAVSHLGWNKGPGSRPR